MGRGMAAASVGRYNATNAMFRPAGGAARLGGAGRATFRPAGQRRGMVTTGPRAVTNRAGRTNVLY